MSADRQALAQEVWTRLVPDVDVWTSPSVSEAIDAVLTSNWLATHDAEVRADERRRCVEAIEALLRYSDDPSVERYERWICDEIRGALSGLGGEEVEGRPECTCSGGVGLPSDYSDEWCPRCDGREGVEGRG